MKLLIITNNLNIVTTLSNYINLNINNNITILIANNIQSAKLIFSEHTINLIIWDIEIFDFKFYKKNLSYIPLILINNFNNCNENIFKNLKCISLDNLTYLEYFIHKRINFYDNFEDTKIKIINELMRLGFNLKHNGTKYITESILVLKFYYKTNNIQNIYSIVARKYNTTKDNIKSNILKSIDYMYCETEFSKLKMYFSLFEDIKPTPKQVILTILKNI